MQTDDLQHPCRSPSEPRIEEATFYSTEHDADGVPVRTYHTRRTQYGDLRQWHYKISMDVVPQRAAEDVLGRTVGDEENTLLLWNDIWDTYARRQ
jgi:hypothetical protein